MRYAGGFVLHLSQRPDVLVGMPQELQYGSRILGTRL